MAVRVQLKTLTRKFSSALYITGDKAQTNFVVLTPYIDFDETIQRKADLVKSIKARGLNLDFGKIEQRWNFYKMMDDHKTVLEATRTEIYNLINKLKNEDPDANKTDIEKLQLHVKIVRDDLKNVKEYSYGVEENAALGVLKLPNFLHPNTPLGSEVILQRFLEQPKAVDKSHMEIGAARGLIEYTNSTFYFLKSDAALFEFALTNYFQSGLQDAGLTQFSNADFARSVVVEGCGTDYLYKSKVYTLEGASSDINKLHVVGGGSLYSFMAYFAKHSIQQAILPLQFFSVGRKYTPVGEGSDLFTLGQNSVAQVFVATEKTDEAINELTRQITKIYEGLGYHFRVVYVPAHQLEAGESLKVSIQMFSNFSQRYVQVGNVSLYDDYLSKRLLFTYNVGKERKFLNVVAGEVLNVQKFLGCALENNSNGTPLLTELLQKYL